jgi:hypothetical protein
MILDLEKRIAVEKTQVAALHSKLDDARTPYIKRQLTFARHLLDDAEAGLRNAKATPTHEGMWLDFVAMTIQNANRIRQTVEDVVEKYGGPEKIIEYRI